MSDTDGGNRVDSSNAEHHDAENDSKNYDGMEDAGTERLSTAAMMFWIFIGFLGLLGVCVLVTVVLALLKGS